MRARWSDYQREIFANGGSGQRSPVSTDLTTLENSAREHLEPGPFWFVAGGAGSGSTMRANREALDRWRIVPRVLREATEQDLRTSILGADLSAPVLLAPIGIQSIVHPDGELATARAAAALGLPVVLSTASSYSLEDVAEANGDGTRWFQLYWLNDRDVCLSMLDRARRAGYSTLVLTVDTWNVGWRPRDLDQAYSPLLTGAGLAIPFSDPAFRAGLARPPEKDLAAAIQHWVSMFGGVDRNWNQLSFLRENWSGPIVLKGIQHVEDARRAVDAGMDGISVSNHGGRQIDGAIGSLDALPTIVDAVGDQLTVLFDSGIRNGADVIKALALGAEAVLFGRPVVYALAGHGEPGVRHVLRTLLAEIEITLGLAGYRRPDELTPDALRRC